MHSRVVNGVSTSVHLSLLGSKLWKANLDFHICSCISLVPSSDPPRPEIFQNSLWMT